MKFRWRRGIIFNLHTFFIFKKEVFKGRLVEPVWWFCEKPLLLIALLFYMILGTLGLMPVGVIQGFALHASLENLIREALHEVLSRISKISGVVGFSDLPAWRG